MSTEHEFPKITVPGRLGATPAPWVTLDPEYALDPTGPWTALPPVVLAVEDDPAAPAPLLDQAVTAPLDTAYFRFRFTDADGVHSSYSLAVLSPGGDDSAPLCTIADIDAQLRRGQATGAYTPEMKLAARAAATSAFETEAGVAFSTRTTTRVIRSAAGAPDGGLYLPDPLVQSVSAVKTSAGAQWTPGQVAALRLDGDTVYGLAAAPVTVTYTHGHDQTPPDVARAVAVLAASLLKDGPYDDRGFGVTDTGGAIRLMTAGIGGAAFSLPEVQAALNRHRYRSFLGV